MGCSELPRVSSLDNCIVNDEGSRINLRFWLDKLHNVAVLPSQKFFSKMCTNSRPIFIFVGFMFPLMYVFQLRKTGASVLLFKDESKIKGFRCLPIIFEASCYFINA